MILIDNNKHACVECIRGHRSSQCKHHTRPLLQVRAKGRPNIQNNPSYRIAVFSKKIDTTTPQEAKVVNVLKWSMKYIVDFNNGSIIGPYDQVNNKINNETIKINNDSFINKTSCCSKKFKNNSCGCGGGEPNKSKILKKYLKRRNFTFINNNDEAKEESIKHQLNQSLYACTAPGTCYCDDDCTCEGCEVHGNDANGDDANGDNANGDNVNGDSIAIAGNNAINAINGNNDSVNPNLNVNPKLDPFDLDINDLLAGNLSMYEWLLQSANVPSESVSNGSTPINSGDSQGYCKCPSSDCSCTNCETHGIINGIRLDDLFNSFA